MSKEIKLIMIIGALFLFIFIVAGYSAVKTSQCNNYGKVHGVKTEYYFLDTCYVLDVGLPLAEYQHQLNLRCIRNRFSN